MLGWLCIPLAFAIGMYLLYRQGVGVAKCIAAVMFAFWPKKDRDKVTLKSCSGWVQHVGRFSKNQVYEFVLDSRLSNGTAEVFLLDRGKRILLHLSQSAPYGKIELVGSGRYYLRWKFTAATGTCELCWQLEDTTIA